ncbi:uncharacterized protein D12 [Hetaerina americana]|uniref:uncharacterized protein D12 n=1 Tax=Hetaerina americana TaxID=62018 RepID=UPI003A7F28B4
MFNRKRRHSEDNEDSQYEQLVSSNSEVADSVVPKALEVIRCEFKNELKRREWELDEIDCRLKEALRIQHLLRYAVVTSYYNVRTSMAKWPDASNSRQIPHPAVAGLSRKKKPNKRIEERVAEIEACDSDGQLEDKGNIEDDSNGPTKIPCYIPPATKKVANETTSPTRGFHTKTKYCIIVGNVSQWIPVDSREDGASHKWMVYARTPPTAPPIAQFVSKVRFFLHSSYRPFDVVEVVSPPFRLSRCGWGEFPIRVQVHFCNPLNKPIDIIHHLVLDRTKSGLQALGAETVVEGWLLADSELRNKCEDDIDGHCSSRTWEENSQGPADGCSSDTAQGSESGSMEGNSCSRMFSREKRGRCYSSSWASQNVPSVFNECTLMSEEDIKKENVEEESNSSDDDLEGSARNHPSDVKGAGVGIETSEVVQNFEDEKVLLGQVAIKEEPIEEQDDAEELLPGSPVDKEEIVLCDVNQDCSAVKEEIVIEDGCFPRPSEEECIVDMTSFHTIGCASDVGGDIKVMPNSGGQIERSQVPLLKVQNTVNNFGGRLSLLTPEPASLRLSKSIVQGENISSHKPGSMSIAKPGPPKGASLLKNLSIRPGTSVLIQNPSLASASRTIQPSNQLAFKSTHLNLQPVNKPAIDPKTATLIRNFSKLKNRVHDNQEAATSHLLKALPIISPNASDPAYRALHLYAANSLDEFFSWPVAKQRAAEWIRAGEVRKLLTDQGFSMEEENAWTNKDIMMWARLRGYTPLSPKVPHAPLHFSPNEEYSDMALNLTTTFSEPKIVNEWLSSFEGEKFSPVNENNAEEIDVVNVGGPPKRPNSSGNQRVGLGARAAGGHKVILLGMEPSLADLSRLIDEFSRKIGVIASCPEEIAPCVFYPATQRVLVEVVKSFMNDLLRGSYSYALRRTSKRPDSSMVIKVEDIRNAVFNRQEFDILTNEGLSAEPDDSMKWDGPM